MLENLSQRFSKVIKSLKGQAIITESNTQEMLREVRRALLEADVALPVVREFIDTVRQKALGQDVLKSLTPGQALVGVFLKELTEILGGVESGLNLMVKPPVVILMAGLQGAGKTTTVGKLAKFLIEKEKKKVMTVSCDVHRFAAIEQLKAVSAQAGAYFFPSVADQLPVDIASAALKWACTHYYDVLLVDTAGRLSIDASMMKEIGDIHECLAPAETLFVLDSMQGQDALQTAKVFSETIPLTGVILTKLDGDSRGGAALSVKVTVGVPIKFVGMGEKVAALEKFYPERMANRILGMGDIASLVEEANRAMQNESSQALSEKIKSGRRFDLNDFAVQLKQMQQMNKDGGLASILDKLPVDLQTASKEINLSDADKKTRRMIGIICSMTQSERKKPELIKANQRRRIATGAGVTIHEVNQLLAQFKQVEQLFGKVQKGGIGKLLKGLKGLIRGANPFSAA